jgi:hypothetical protein
MAKLGDVQKKIRQDPKWGFLAEMIGATDLDQSTAGVVNGVLLVNPGLALAERTDVFVEKVRGAFTDAQRERRGS